MGDIYSPIAEDLKRQNNDLWDHRIRLFIIDWWMGSPKERYKTVKRLGKLPSEVLETLNKQLDRYFEGNNKNRE